MIGDGAITGGMSYEAMNHAGFLDKNMIVILNDNQQVNHFLEEVLISVAYNARQQLALHIRPEKWQLLPSIAGPTCVNCLCMHGWKAAICHTLS